MTDQPTPRADQEDASAALLGLLDDLARVVSGARPMPMSASVLVNKAEVLDLIAAAREAVPDQVAAADLVVAQAQEVLARAHTEADGLRQEAREEAARLVSEHQITAEAREQAAEIVSQATDKAAQLEADADEYCDSRLAQFETDLGAVSQQVAAGRARLAARRSGR